MSFINSVHIVNEIQPQVIGAFVFVLGSMIGSFMNVVIYRLPIMINDKPDNFNLARPSSRCSTCGELVRWWQNIPLLSYAFLAGKCYYCHSKIGARYFIVELISGLIALSAWWALGLHSEFLILSAFALCLLTLTLIDFDSRLLPDVMTLPLILAGVALAGMNLTPPSLISSLTGAVVGYSSLWAINAVFRAMKGIDGIGGGDMKLLAAAGAWLGASYVPDVLFLAAIIACVPAITQKLLRKEQVIAFGPYLSVATLAFFIVTLVESASFKFFAL